MLLGGDVARASRFRVYGGLPGMAYLPTRFVLRLVERVGPDHVRRVLQENPLSLLRLDRAAAARRVRRNVRSPPEPHARWNTSGTTSQA